jgi:hypothetical protein
VHQNIITTLSISLVRLANWKLNTNAITVKHEVVDINIADICTPTTRMHCELVEQTISTVGSFPHSLMQNVPYNSRGKIVPSFFDVRTPFL